MDRKRIDIAMLSCNRRRLTEMAVREIKDRTTMPHRLIVLDNGSEDGSYEMLLELADDGLIDELLYQDENYGVHWGFNRLLEEIETDYYICTDNDLIPESPRNGSDWLAKISSLLDRHPRYGAIACRPHILIGEPANRFDDAGEVRPMSHIGAHLRIMRTSLVRDVGGWRGDTREPSRDNEDWWIGGKLDDAGFEVGYSRDIRAIHLFGKDEFDEDDWGYPLSLYGEPNEHGHTERWPPVSHYSWERQGIDWETCQPKS